ncbi:YcgL domain-containing protein [Agaribacter flavus]|uniref:YcgL domain-containing protein ACFOHL_02815 n=1 Tax=Agaribacter flavus TaxID=1902781 RepID=A0ABV7FJS6_9ALTE
MLCAVYKSAKKADTFLYIAKRDDFSQVPEILMQTFGVPKFVMLVNTTDKRTIAGLATDKFIEKFEEQGFYLQLPPKQEDLMEAHRVKNGLDKIPDIKF